MTKRELTILRKYWKEQKAALRSDPIKRKRYNEYMREYMKQYRAKKKAEK